MDAPVISVVMPVYNGEKYIRQAIESVLCQKVPLELIIVDDCSNDRTQEMVLGYLSAGNVFYYKNEKNEGAAFSRNYGSRLAKGAYIAFLDADDWWTEGKLEKQLERLKKTNAVLCCTARELIHPDGSSAGKVIPVREEITYKYLLSHNSIACSSVVAKAEAIREFPMEHEDSQEDYITWMRILRKYGSACGINEPMLKYRMSFHSKSGNKLKSAKMTFRAYRYMGFGLPKSLCLFVSYAVHGVIKYL